MRLLWADPIVFSSDLTLIRELLFVDRENRISPGREVALRPVMGRHSVLFAHGEHHLRLRRLMAPALQSSDGDRHADLGRALTRSRIATWPLEERFALLERLQHLVLEILVTAVFAPRDPARTSTLIELFSTLRELNALAPRRRWMRFQNRLGVQSRLDRALVPLHRLIAEEVEERRRNRGPDGDADLLSRYARARLPDGRALTGPELRDQVVTVIMAGHETSAVGLAWTLELLARNPRAEAEAAAGAARGDGSFLAAVIRESLRLRPVIPTMGRRLGSGRRLGGFELPAGTIVSPSIYLAHTSPQNFEAPREFRPERFLDGASPPGWMPFGGGVHRCLGASLAETLIWAVLSELLPRLSLRLATPAAPRIVSRSVLWAPARGLPVVARARRSS